MRQIIIILASWTITGAANVWAEPVRAAYPSANVQFLPAFVALEKGFYKREASISTALMFQFETIRGSISDWIVW